LFQINISFLFYSVKFVKKAGGNLFRKSYKIRFYYYNMVNKSKTELFLELAKPNEKGISRWVDVSEFVGNYKDLTLGNGGSWCRKESKLAKTYRVEFDKSKSNGNSIDRVCLNGFAEKEIGTQHIRNDIKNTIRKIRLN